MVLMHIKTSLPLQRYITNPAISLVTAYPTVPAAGIVETTSGAFCTSAIDASVTSTARSKKIFAMLLE